MTRLVLALALAACGVRVGARNDAGPTGSSFSALRNDIFTPGCGLRECHSGAPPPFAPMSLDAPVAWANLVSVPSIQVPRLQLVTPGEPDESYLMLKLEGQATTRMPLGRPPLAEEQLERIRTWIERGAPDD